MMASEKIRNGVESLGPWFHNIDLNGVKTAPQHFLGDYPAQKWQRFAAAVPADLSGRSVLDIGCNAGFYSIEMKRRGAARHLRREFLLHLSGSRAARFPPWVESRGGRGEPPSFRRREAKFP